ncbi:MAG: SRPBCC domain-containing protein [Microthrixaceae bacterium]
MQTPSASGSGPTASPARSTRWMCVREAEPASTWRRPTGPMFANRFDYVEVVPGERLVMDHGSDADDDPERFRVTITLDEQGDGKTVLTLRQIHPTAELREQKIGFGAEELGLQTMDKLARHLGVP